MRVTDDDFTALANFDFRTFYIHLSVTVAFFRAFRSVLLILEDSKSLLQHENTWKYSDLRTKMLAKKVRNLN